MHWLTVFYFNCKPFDSLRSFLLYSGLCWHPTKVWTHCDVSCWFVVLKPGVWFYCRFGMTVCLFFFFFFWSQERGCWWCTRVRDFLVLQLNCTLKYSHEVQDVEQHCLVWSESREPSMLHLTNSLKMTCQSQDSHYLNHLLDLFVYYSKWDQNVQNEHHALWKTTWH